MYMYPQLEAEISKRGIKLQAISRELHISQRSLHNKRRGVSPFTWPEVCIIQNMFFPDLSKEHLFRKETTERKGA